MSHLGATSYSCAHLARPATDHQENMLRKCHISEHIASRRGHLYALAMKGRLILDTVNLIVI